MFSSIKVWNNGHQEKFKNSKLSILFLNQIWKLFLVTIGALYLVGHFKTPKNAIQHFLELCFYQNSSWDRLWAPVTLTFHSRARFWPESSQICCQAAIKSNSRRWALASPEKTPKSLGFGRARFISFGGRVLDLSGLTRGGKRLIYN